MKKLILAPFILTSFLFAQTNAVEKEAMNFENVIKSLPNTVDNKLLNEMGMSKKEEVLSRKETIKKEFEKFKFAIEQMDDESFKKLALDNYSKGMEYLENKENITLFYFISEDTSDESIRSFMSQIDVLNSHNKNIMGRILLNNYPSNFVDSISGKVNKIVTPLTKESPRGALSLLEDGSYVYKIKNISGMIPGEELIDSFIYNTPDGMKFSLDIKLKVDKKTNLKVVGSTIVDSMLPFMINLREKKIGSKNVKLHVHPWAFDALKLKEVPAYVLGYCDPNDFKFRDCENKYIAKGNITLEYFMSLVAEKNNDYEKLYNLFKEGKK